MQVNALPVEFVVFVMHLYIVLHILVQCMTDQIFYTAVHETGHTGEDNVFVIIHHCDYWLMACVPL